MLWKYVILSGTELCQLMSTTIFVLPESGILVTYPLNTYTDWLNNCDIYIYTLLLYNKKMLIMLMMSSNNYLTIKFFVK